MLSVGDIVRKTQPSLFWCMRGLSKPKRDAIYTLFAFCRHLGNIQRSNMSVFERQELLKAWQEELNNIYEKHIPSTDIGRKIYKHCMRFNLPKMLWQNIIDSTLMNAINPLQGPKTVIFEQYINGISIVPFHLALMIMDNTHPTANASLAKNLGSAVMITYILRDIKDDAKNNHLYIPQEILEKANVQKDTPRNMVENNNMAIARAELSKQAEEGFNKAGRMLDKMNKSETMPLRLIKNISYCQYEMMKKRGWEIISPKPQINFTQRMNIVYRTMFK